MTEEPTYKQREFAEEIASVLCIPLPTDYSKQGYSKWISEHIKEYKDEMYFLMGTYEHENYGDRD